MTGSQTLVAYARLGLFYQLPEDPRPEDLPPPNERLDLDEDDDLLELRLDELEELKLDDLRELEDELLLSSSTIFGSLAS